MVCGLTKIQLKVLLIPCNLWYPIAIGKLKVQMQAKLKSPNYGMAMLKLKSRLAKRFRDN